MIQLDYGFAKGRKVSIPSRLSWQTSEAGVGGVYEIIDRRQEDILLRRISDGKQVFVESRSLAYLMGKQVPSAAPYVPLDADEFLPSPLEKNFATEEDYDAELGFWYCGSMGDIPCIESSLLGGTWCYYKPHPFPWK